jgi:hypothetical protein
VEGVDHRIHRRFIRGLQIDVENLGAEAGAQGSGAKLDGGVHAQILVEYPWASWPADTLGERPAPVLLEDAPSLERPKTALRKDRARAAQEVISQRLDRFTKRRSRASR